MGEFNRAIAPLPMPLVCPKCGGMNLPAPASPTIKIDAHREADCSICGHAWKV